MKRVAAFLFEHLVRLRAWLYQRGFLTVHQLPRPVVSVGNLSVGGTGKTPFVGYLAEVLMAAGYQPAVLSRGYRRESKDPVVIVSRGQGPLCSFRESGDEPYLLARSLPGVSVVVGSSRYKSGEAFLVHDDSPKRVFILDDGYQHLGLRRNLDILLLDGTDPFGGGLLPQGRLREPFSAVSRADLVIVNRAQYCTEADLIEERVRLYNPLVPVHYFYHDAVGLRDLRSGESLPLRSMLNQPVAALSGIGNPEVFLRDLAHYQMNVVQRFIFRDHHPFSQDDLEPALDTVRRGEVKALVTTEKDAVRLEELKFDTTEILALRIVMRPEDPEGYKAFLLDELKTVLEPGARDGGR